MSDERKLPTTLLASLCLLALADFVVGGIGSMTVAADLQNGGAPFRGVSWDAYLLWSSAVQFPMGVLIALKLLALIRTARIERHDRFVLWISAIAGLCSIVAPIAILVALLMLQQET